MLRTHPTSFAAALLALALGPVSVFAQTSDAVGVVTTLSGQATVSRTGLTEPASMRFRDPVFTRDRISTGEKSIVRVLLGGKAVVTARELSVLTINEESLRSTVILDSGKVGASVVKERMKPGETIEFRTPNAVAVVRGTVLVVEVTEGPVPASGGPAPITTTVSVIRGAVDVFALNGGTITPVRVGGQESVRVTGGRLGTLRALTPQESRAITADLEVAPGQQHQSKSVPLDVRRSIGASEQAKAAALVSALAPETGKGNDKKVGAALADTSAITRDAVDGVAGKGKDKGTVGAVDNVLLEASSLVVGRGSKVVGTAGGAVASTTDAVVGQGSGGSASGAAGGASTAVTGSVGGAVGGAVGGIGAAVGRLSGSGISGGGLSSGLSGSGISGGGLSSGVSGSGVSGGGLSSGVSGSGVSGGGVIGAANGLVNGVANGLLRR